MIPLRSPGECGASGPRGQPVVALAMILAMWIAVRMTFIALDSDPAAGHTPLIAQPQNEGALPPPALRGAGRFGAASALPAEPRRHRARRATLAMPYPSRRSGAGAVTADFSEPAAAPFRSEAAREEPGERSGIEAALVPAQEAGPMPGQILASGPGLTPRPSRPRWTADGWLLLRGGGGGPSLAAGAASYGGSQAGGVLRYGLAPSSPLRPQAYVRMSTAIGGPAQQAEAAFGLMARPVRRLPVAVLGEMRLQQQAGPSRVRPVVMAVTELPPLAMPLAVEAEAYAQGGWAGGSGATAFFDLAATAQRPVLRPLPGIQLSAGGGVWSGGQRGVARLDLGPRIELKGMVGPPSRRIGVRVGVDWRFRVAGRAKPGSGPALTLAAGF